MLLSFVWTLAVLTLIAEKKYGVKVIGTVTMPVAIVGVVLMQLLRTEVHPLVPALQSTWLHVHVTLAMLAYAACALSFALAMMFLIQDKLKTETVLAVTSSSTIAIYASIVLTRFEKWGGLNLVAWNPENKSEIFISKGVRLFVVVPDLGWLMMLSLLVVASPLVFYGLARLKNIASKKDSFLTSGQPRGLSQHPVQVMTLVMFLLRARDGRYPSLDADGLFPTSLAASPFILSGPGGRNIYIPPVSVTAVAAARSRAFVAQCGRSLTASPTKPFVYAFPLLTLMIASGAYWANQTWGSYWSWDPKETWAAITWLVYAGYLHMRITRGWRGRRAAYFAILGFAVVMFTFFGVTYLLPGLHAYA